MITTIVITAILTGLAVVLALNFATPEKQLERKIEHRYAVADPQFRRRGMVREVADPRLGPVLHPGIVPHMPEDPGAIRWPGPPIGAHTDEVLGEMLGLHPAEIDGLRQEGVI